MELASLDKRARERILPTLVGAGVPALSGWGEVVSVFAQAVNIRHAQRLLVSFVRKIRAMTFLSVCLPGVFGEQKKGFLPGDRVRFEGQRLVTEHFVVDFLGRPTWQGTLTRDDVKGFSASKVFLVKEALLLKGRGGGFLGLLRKDEANNPFVDEAARVLSDLQSAPSRVARLKVLSGLVGLGPGSTPSGDDFISGFLMGEEISRLMLSAGAKAVARDQRNMVASAMKKEDLWAAMNRTNDAGRTLLWQSFQRHFPKYLIDTVRSVSDAKGKQEIADAVERAVGRGATSGTDVLTGFVFSMAGWF